jgi:hypothetical protein
MQTDGKIGWTEVRKAMVVYRNLAKVLIAARITQNKLILCGSGKERHYCISSLGTTDLKHYCYTSLLDFI